MIFTRAANLNKETTLNSNGHPLPNYSSDGTIDPGDGSRWRLYGKGAMHSGLITGAPDSTAELASDLTAAASASGHTTVWHINPRGAAARPILSSAYTAVDRDGIHDMIVSLGRVVEERWQPGQLFEPTHDLPGLLVVIEDLRHVLADRVTVRRLESFIERCPNAGVAFILTADNDSLEVFGGSNLIRDYVVHNRVHLHYSAPVAGGAERLASRAGHGFYLESGSGDAVYVRAYRLGDTVEA